jgi:Holliday junction resolvase RusA-like endonuclease
MNTLKFFVHGTPKAQPRVKAFSRGGHAGVYTPGTADHWKACVSIAAAMHRPPSPMVGALIMELEFRLPRPKSHYLRGQLRVCAPKYCTTKPDLDNLEKAVLDALTRTGLVWSDDAQVCELRSAKVYANNADELGCEVTISIL